MSFRRIFRDGRKLLIAVFKYCAQFDPILRMLSGLFQEYRRNCTEAVQCGQRFPSLRGL